MTWATHRRGAVRRETGDRRLPPGAKRSPHRRGETHERGAAGGSEATRPPKARSTRSVRGRPATGILWKCPKGDQPQTLKHEHAQTLRSTNVTRLYITALTLRSAVLGQQETVRAGPPIERIYDSLLTLKLHIHREIWSDAGPVILGCGREYYERPPEGRSPPLLVVHS